MSDLHPERKLRPILKTRLNAPAIHTLATPPTPGTLDRSRRFRQLSTAYPKLHTTINEVANKHCAYEGTTDKRSILRILLDVTDAITCKDAQLQDKLRSLAFEEVCSLLNIDGCLVSEIQKTLLRCCRDKFSCLPCL